MVVNEKKVARVMRKYAIAGIRLRKKVRTTGARARTSVDGRRRNQRGQRRMRVLPRLAQARDAPGRSLLRRRTLRQADRVPLAHPLQHQAQALRERTAQPRRLRTPTPTDVSYTRPCRMINTNACPLPRGKAHHRHRDAQARGVRTPVERCRSRTPGAVRAPEPVGGRQQPSAPRRAEDPQQQEPGLPSPIASQSPSSLVSASTAVTRAAGPSTGTSSLDPTESRRKVWAGFDLSRRDPSC